MKRKALREFADYLENTRGPFNILNNEHCIAAYASKWFKEPLNGWYVLDRFEVSREVVFDLYTGSNTNAFMHNVRITRKVAANALRRLARTGQVEFRA